LERFGREYLYVPYWITNESEFPIPDASPKIVILNENFLIIGVDMYSLTQL
jgi:hypothetical protein